MKKAILMLTLLAFFRACLPAVAGAAEGSPGRAAWEKGRELAEAAVAGIRAREGRLPGKVAALVWCGETARDEGVMVSFVLSLVGVRPVWDREGEVRGLELIPPQELARPRLDAVVIISGLFRDNFEPAVVLMDRAFRLALAASYHEIARNHPELKEALEAALLTPGMAGLSSKGEEPLEQNFVAGHWVRLAKEYLAAGKSPWVAGRLAAARIFGPPPGGYGAGIGEHIKGGREGLAALYAEQLGHTYGEDTWGEENVPLFREQLKDVEFAFHSRNTELYGLLDNTVSYDYCGGLLLSLEKQGKQSEMFIIGGPAWQIQTLSEYLTEELSTKYFDPRWVEANPEKGFGFVSNLWGWQVTVPRVVREWMWEGAYGMYREAVSARQKIIRSNPCLLIRFVGTLIAAAQKGYWHPDEAALRELAIAWLQLTAAYGEKCSWYRENPEITAWARSYLEKATPSPPGTEERAEATRGAPVEPVKPGEAPEPDAKGQGPGPGGEQAAKREIPPGKAYEVEVARPPGLAKVPPAFLPLAGVIILLIVAAVRHVGGRVRRRAER